MALATAQSISYLQKRRFTSIVDASDSASHCEVSESVWKSKRPRRESPSQHQCRPLSNSDAENALRFDLPPVDSPPLENTTRLPRIVENKRLKPLPWELPRWVTGSTEGEFSDVETTSGSDTLKYMDGDDGRYFSEPYIGHLLSEMMKDFDSKYPAGEARPLARVFGGERFGEPFMIDTDSAPSDISDTSTCTGIEAQNLTYFGDSRVNRLLSEAQINSRDIQDEVDMGQSADWSLNTIIGRVTVEFNRILRDESCYRKLLKCAGYDPGEVLDVLQMLVDYTLLSTSTRRRFLVASLRFSKKFGLYPQCFKLKDVQREGSPVTAGHFGEIWKGHLREHDICLKVVKVYQKSQIEHLLKAFSREAILWGHLSHRNLLPFYGIYHLEDGYERVCLISPWMDNGNINEYLKINSEANRLLLICDIAHGLSSLHEIGIIHGDLKGANILVTASGRACLADFGLCTIMDAEILRWTSIESSVHVGGTVRWQAPELIDPDHENALSTKESDIYAFSCVCYEIFTGQVPFYEVPREFTVIYKVMQGNRPTRPYLSARGPGSYFAMGLTESTWDLMEQCWKINPKERPLVKEVIRRLPVGDIADKRPHGEWGDLSPSRFRSNIYASSSEHPSVGILEKIVEWLQTLK